MRPIRIRRLTHAAEIQRVEHALEAFYRTRPDHYGLDTLEEQGLTAYARLIQTVAAPGSMVLEFGAGSSRLPLIVQRHGFNVVGCDLFSETDLARQNAQLSNNLVRLISYDGRTVPAPDASFDVVSSRNVFEHVVRMEETLAELDRVLKPGGLFVLVGPNWSGPHNPLRALVQLLRGAERYWLFESIAEATLGLARTAGWYLEARLSPTPCFLLIAPRMRDGDIDFEDSDDDAVHLCHPLSFRRWFRRRGYQVLRYNRRIGPGWKRYWNTICPSLATSNEMVFRKGPERLPA